MQDQLSWQVVAIGQYTQLTAQYRQLQKMIKHKHLGRCPFKFVSLGKRFTDSEIWDIRLDLFIFLGGYWVFAAAGNRM